MKYAITLKDQDQAILIDLRKFELSDYARMHKRLDPNGGANNIKKIEIYKHVVGDGFEITIEELINRLYINFNNLKIKFAKQSIDGQIPAFDKATNVLRAKKKKILKRRNKKNLNRKNNR